MVDFIALMAGLIGYLIARSTCARIIGYVCENNFGLQIVFLFGLLLIVVALLIVVYEKVVWKYPKLDLDGENAEEEQSK